MNRHQSFEGASHRYLQHTGHLLLHRHTAANWSTGKIPTAITHVIITSGTPYNCVIGIADAQAASVQLLNGAKMQAINNKTLSIKGECLALPNLLN